MCGITGIYAFNQIGRLNMINLARATQQLESRGPDNQGIFHDEFVGLGHRRLSVIDTSSNANQPMSDPLGRYHLVYNGEIYNFKSFRQELEDAGVSFNSSSDTEVLLHLLIRHGESCLLHLNGFFALAFYDSQEGRLLIARDRFGIKPLYFYQDVDKLMFASELKSLLEYGFEKKINKQALHLYMQLSYVPAPLTMLAGVSKLEPGQIITVDQGEVSIKKYYTPEINHRTRLTFDQAKDHLLTLMEQSVTDRLMSDVPLGTFLSGGLDSSVISAIAARHHPDLQTFSIGYKDEPFFDETAYAEDVARYIGSRHTTFRLSNRDLYDHVFEILDYLDEPFADSSAIAVYILSKETRKHVTVALSGDGADELFGGYNKHAAMKKVLQGGLTGSVVSGMGFLWNVLPASRNGAVANKVRQLKKFARLHGASAQDQYWFLASITDAESIRRLLKPDYVEEEAVLSQFKDTATNALTGHKDIMNHFLLTDLKFVLPNDMLYKVDKMSMANSLEVRVPFMDHRVVDFALSLPEDYKINGNHRKRILKEAFRSYLPGKLFKRAKKGFEVPLMKWFKGELRGLIENDLLSDDFIEEQQIFNVNEVRMLKKKLYSANPGDAQAQVWSMIVFQWWYKKYFS